MGSALGVGAGAWVVAELAKNDNVERIVRVLGHWPLTV
jgi:hypothetical protein